MYTLNSLMSDINSGDLDMILLALGPLFSDFRAAHDVKHAMMTVLYSCGY